MLEKKRKKRSTVRKEQEAEDLDKICGREGTSNFQTPAPSPEDEKIEPTGTAEVRGRKGGKEEEAVEDFVSIKKDKEKKVVAAETTREANEEMKNGASYQNM